MLIRIGAILFCASVLAGPASAQTETKILGGIERLAPEANRKARNDASFCKGSLEGRWRLIGGTMLLDGTVHVRASGRIAEETVFVNLFSGPFGVAETKGGRFLLHDPIYEDGEKNRCWLDGCIRLRGGHSICVTQMFSVPGAALYQGWGTVDGQMTTMHMSRY